MIDVDLLVDAKLKAEEKGYVEEVPRPFMDSRYLARLAFRRPQN